MLVQKPLLVFRDATPRGRKKEKKKNQQWNQTAQLLQQAPHHAELGTTGSANVPGPLHRTSQSWNASWNYSRGRYTTRTPQEGRSPSLWRDSVKNNWLTVISIKTTYAGIFVLFSLAQAANQQHAGTTPNSMPQLRPQTASTRSPKSPGPPTPFPTPKPLARPSRSLASNNRASLLKRYL